MAESSPDLPESTETLSPAETMSAAGAVTRLWSRSFIGLLATMFLGAFNDNMYRWLAVHVGTHLFVQAGSSNAQQNALTLGAATFLLPFVILAPLAAYLADRFSKGSVMRGTKLAEIGIMAAGSLAIGLDNATLMFVVLFCMGAQSTLFGPARMGGVPEMIPSSLLSAANGVMNLATMVSIILGSIAGHFLWDVMKPGGLVPGTGGLWIAVGALLTAAVLGWLASLFIQTGPAADPARKLPWNPFAEMWHDFRIVTAHRGLLRVVLAIAFFWMLGCLAQLNIETYGKEELHLTLATQTGFLLVAMALGVGIGSIFAGVLSRGRVEMGFVPLGALGLALNAVLLWTSTDSYTMAMVWLFFLGFFGGMYDVPLTAYLQKNSPEESRGSIFALSNCLSFTAMILITGVHFVLHGNPPTGLGLTPGTIFLIAAGITFPVALYMFSVVPADATTLLIRFICRFFYVVRVRGREHVPTQGGVLIVCNHISWLDAILVGIAVPRSVRFIAFDENMKLPGIRVISSIFRTILINSKNGPKALLRSLQTANEALKEGDAVCIFAEGGISRTGQLLGFQRGLMRIVQGTDAPVLPMVIEGMWGSLFSFSGGRFFKKWPRRWPYPVSIMIGEPIPQPKDQHEVRQAVQRLGAEAVIQHRQQQLALPRQFIRQCRAAGKRPKIADSTGQQLTGSELLLRTAVLRRLLLRHVLQPDEKLVGVLLPPSVGGLLVNAALPTLGRVPVNLNYTVSEADLKTHVAACKLRHVLTSRAFMEKMKFDLPVEYVYLEDFKEKATAADKFAGACAAYVLPITVLERMWGLTRIKPDDLLTIIFTSGSTGEAKGVMLSYHNVASNIAAIDQLFQLKTTDVLLGTLPMFHSFGFTGTTWSVLALNPKGVYHYNPLDARVVGKLCQDHGTTILMSTPTFLRSYVKRCDKEQFAKLDLVITGAEKLPDDLSQAFEEKFGVRPAEGYGTTELSPLAAVNIPDHRSTSFTQVGTKPGTVGRPVPGVAAKIIDPDTGAELGVDTPGMLLIKGPNVMQGYLNQPARTAEVIHDGWYRTGDIAMIDADGFIQITGRQSRFSKIGGEMVPHIKIEETLGRILACPEDETPELRAVVTAVPDQKKGERLVVLHKRLAKPVDQICKELSAEGLPNLWIPSTDSFIEVTEIPVLGTGKLDLKALKDLALQRTSASV